MYNLSEFRARLDRIHWISSTMGGIILSFVCDSLRIHCHRIVDVASFSFEFSLEEMEPRMLSGDCFYCIV